VGGPAPEARLNSRFGISKEQGAAIRKSVGTPRLGSCFPPTAAAIQDPAWLFLEQRLAQATSHVTWPCSVFLGQGLGHDQLALLITRGWRSVCWPIRDSPALFLEVLDSARRRPPDHRCKIETDQHPMDHDAAGGWEHQTGPLATRCPHKFAVIDGKTGDHRSFT